METITHRRKTICLATFFLSVYFLSTGFGCSKKSSPTAGPLPPLDTIGNPPLAGDTSGICPLLCDANPVAYPQVDSLQGLGAITTYGSVASPEPSGGGACNYGVTEVYQYAAIQVNRMPGDAQGQWQGGRACGQCALVRTRTKTGWKETVVRIMDKCPDAYCGIDLGGLPAKALMGDQPGRYSGEWRFVSCKDHPEVFDGKPSLFVKEGSNSWWSLVQVRNALDGVSTIRMQVLGAEGTAPWDTLAWAKEAENFFSVPAEVLMDTAVYVLDVRYHSGESQALRIKGLELAHAEALFLLLDSTLSETVP